MYFIFNDEVYTQEGWVGAFPRHCQIFISLKKWLQKNTHKRYVEDTFLFFHGKSHVKFFFDYITFFDKQV